MVPSSCTHMAFPPKFGCNLAFAACAVILSSFFVGNVQAGCAHSNADSAMVTIDFRGVEVAVNRVYEDGIVKYFFLPNGERPCNGPQCRSSVPTREKSMPSAPSQQRLELTCVATTLVLPAHEISATPCLLNESLPVSPVSPGPLRPPSC